MTLNDHDAKVRQRENKRRHRARQQELVRELQQRVNDARSQEIDATKEVQAAAQKVVNDNKRLRELLHCVGVDHAAIESWLRGEETAVRSLPITGPVSPCSSDALSVPTPLHTATRGCSRSTQTSTHDIVPLDCSSGAENDTSLAPLMANQPSMHQVSVSPKESDQAVSNSAPDDRHCMSVSHFLNGANTGCVAGTDSTTVGRVGDDIECSRAYQMVMPFASSHDKVEAISQKLKEGCIIDKKCGGCKVKAEVMWEVLEDAMNGV